MIDVGANIGLTAVPIAMSGVKCMCFEPDLNNFGLLKSQHTEQRDLTNVKLFNVAVFDDQLRGFAQKSPDWNHGDHRVRLVDTKVRVQRATRHGHQKSPRAAPSGMVDIEKYTPPALCEDRYARRRSSCLEGWGRCYIVGRSPVAGVLPLSIAARRRARRYAYRVSSRQHFHRGVHR